MSKGFGKSTDELKIAIIMKRLTPAIERKDHTAFATGLAKMQQRYGSQLVDVAAARLIEQHPWLFQNAMQQRQDVAQIAPNVDLDRLLRMARYDDRALLRLCSFVHDGIKANLAPAH